MPLLTTNPAVGSPAASPIWNGVIVDRDELRTALTTARHQWQRRLPYRWWQPVYLWHTSAMLPLHQYWLRTTAGEAGWWCWPAEWRRTPIWPTGVYLDIGVSGVRLVSVNENGIRLEQSVSDRGCWSLWQAVAAAEANEHQIQVAVADLAGANTLRLPAIDLQTKKPILTSIHHAIWQRCFLIWLSDVAAAVHAALPLLPAATQSILLQSGLQVVGGGAQVAGMATAAASVFPEWPVTVVPDGQYTFLRWEAQT
jgi:hypothetical protein